MNDDINKPFFRDPAIPKEGDLLTWLLTFYSAWEREFYAASGSVQILLSDESIKDKLMEKKAIAEKARDYIGHIIPKENKK